MRTSYSTLTILVLALLNSAALAQTSTYKNPVDGEDYVTDWKTYEPETPKDDSGSRVYMENVRLLVAQEDLAERVNFDSFVAYLKTLEADFLELDIASSDSGTVVLQVDMEPEQLPAYQLAYEGAISTDLLQTYYEKISDHKDVPAVLGTVSFQLSMVIRAHADHQGDETPE